MKRRVFALGLPAAAIMVMAGCKPQQSGDELLGYWIKHYSSGNIQAMLKIQREKDALTMTVAEFTFFSREGHPPSETTYPLVFNSSINQHGVQSELGFIVIRRIGDELAFDSERFTRSNAEQYAEWMKTLLPKIRF